MLILWGVLLTFVPEFIYLLDNFGTRMNTIFKFYYQTWILWSLVAAFIAVLIFRKDSHKKGKIEKILLYSAVVLTGAVVVCTVLIPSSAGFQEQNVEIGNGILDWLWICWAAYLVLTVAYLLIQRGWMTLLRIVLIYLFGIGLFYPLQAIQSRFNELEDLSHWTLDGSEYYRSRDPALMQAVNLLWNEQVGVLAEAVGHDGGDYDSYARVSMLSGMPAVLGWQYHEVQWRGGEDEIGSRPADIALLYETADWETAQALIDKYNIEYIYIGDLERITYQIQEEKFNQNMSLFFDQEDVTIYRRNID